VRDFASERYALVEFSSRPFRSCAIPRPPIGDPLNAERACKQLVNVGRFRRVQLSIPVGPEILKPIHQDVAPAIVR
jgi:hypothetical protein